MSSLPPPPPLLSQRAFEALLPDTFIWGCSIRDGVHFTYTYGTVGDYRRATRYLRAGDMLHKGACETFDEARLLAQDRAGELADVYQGIGSVRALAALAYLKELERPS